jgi:hypothetical protein
MAWLVAGVMIATFVYSLYMQSQMANKTSKALVAPPITASEGVSIPVVFGSRMVTNPNVTWVGDKLVQGNGSLQYPYKYSAGVQMAICHGKIDALLDVWASDKSCMLNLQGPNEEYAWSTYGYVGFLIRSSLDLGTTRTDDELDGTATVYAGAVNASGTVDDGLNTDPTGLTRESYLAKQMSLVATDGTAQGPQYYGVAYAVVRSVFGSSPYFKPVTFAVKRIHTRNGGDTQWYDEKAEIQPGRRSREDIWKYKLQDTTDSSDWSGASYDDSSWAQGHGGIGNAFAENLQDQLQNYTTVPRVCTSLVPDGSLIFSQHRVKAGVKLWLRWNLGPMPVYPVTVQCWHDDSGALWFNGHSIPLTATNITLVNEHFTSQALIPKEYINASGPNVIAYRVMDSFDQITGDRVGTNNYIYAGLQVGVNSETPPGVVDMNPAHIIHEVLTDKFWGMAYNDADLDDSSFRAAADTLYSEGLGMSFVWSEQMTIEDFLTDVLRHISGVLYIDRSSGLFVLKLIRDDYTIGDLLVLDESNVSKIENCTRKQMGELVNTVTITYAATMRGDQGSVTLFDQGVLDAQGGGYVTSKIDYPAITSPVNASKLALRDLRLLSSPLLSCTVTAARHAAQLNIGDPFVLNWPDLQILNVVMRVTEIDIGNGIENQVKVTCAEDVFSFPANAVASPAAPIGSTPTRAPTPSVDIETYYTEQVVDTRNQGMLELCFLGPHAGGGNTPMLADWTEVSPGVRERTVTGPLPSAWLDGVDADAYNTSGTSYLLGRSVLVYYQGGTSLLGDEEPLQGPWVIDDVGGHWENYGTPSQAFVSTNARMHRAPGYDTSTGFVKDMIFQIRNGNSYGGHFIQLSTANVVLGTTLQMWADLGTSFAFADTRELLRSDQLAGQTLSPDSSLTVSATFVSGYTNMNGFETMVGTPGAWSIPAGPWTVYPSGITVTGGDSGATNSLGFLFMIDDGVSPVELFELMSPALTAGFQSLDPLTYTAPQIALTAAKRYVMIPRLHTTSTTPVTFAVTYNAARTIRVTIPRAVTMMVPAVDGWFDVWVVGGVISGFGDHRHLRVHGTGPLVGIDQTGLVGGASLTLSFVDGLTITAAGTPSSGAPLKTKKLGSVYQDKACPADSIAFFALMTDSGTSAFWQYSGGSV